MSDLDLLLVALPKHGVNVPPLSLPYLAGAAKAAGFRVACRDLNLDLWRRTADSSWSHLWEETDTTIFKGRAFDDFVERYYGALIAEWAEGIAAARPRWLGISLFSYRSVPGLRLLVPEVRRRAPEIRIVVGGAPVNTYAGKFVSEGLADAAIRSEGDIALPKLLAGDFDYPGIVHPGRLQSEPRQIEDLSALPLPDYADFRFEDYTPGDPAGFLRAGDRRPRHQRQAGIMGSRGCVRGCGFCDVAHYWPRYRWRTAESLYREMEMLNREHGIADFYFHDSLINGSMTEFEKLLDLLIAKRGAKPFKLKGLAIVRQQPKRLYEKMARAGIVQLQLGVESFSERLRVDMRKGFSDALFKDNLENYAAVGIRLVLLLMAGYPTETEKDHEINLRWLEDYLPYQNKPIHRIDWGGTTIILPGAPLFLKPQTPLYIDRQHNWVSFNGGERNDLATRLRRLRESELRARALGWRVGSSYGEQVMLGDSEFGVIDERPQDELPPLSRHPEGMGWDDERPTVGYQEYS